MNRKSHGGTQIDFNERPVKFRADWNISPFDIVISERYRGWEEEDFELDQIHMYCNALLEILTKVKPHFQQDFLIYQCQLMARPVAWLKALEQFIDKTLIVFIKPDVNI